MTYPYTSRMARTVLLRPIRSYLVTVLIELRSSNVTSEHSELGATNPESLPMTLDVKTESPLGDGVNRENKGTNRVRLHKSNVHLI